MMTLKLRRGTVKIEIYKTSLQIINNTVIIYRIIKCDIEVNKQFKSCLYVPRVLWLIIIYLLKEILNYKITIKISRCNFRILSVNYKRKFAFRKLGKVYCINSMCIISKGRLSSCWTVLLNYKFFYYYYKQ